MITSGPVSAEDNCAELGGAAFYASATTESIQQLIDGGVDVNARDEVGKSALHWITTASPAVVSALLATGANVNAKDRRDRTPLYFVAARHLDYRRGHIDDPPNYIAEAQSHAQHRRIERSPGDRCL
jgi:ankyrin repeat protein